MGANGLNDAQGGLIAALIFGALCLVLNVLKRQSDYQEHFRQSQHQTPRIRLMLGFQWTVIRNGQQTVRQMQWAMA